MNISKIKAAFALLTGGVAGLLKYFLEVFNKQVLGRIPDKESATKYLSDVQAVSALIKSIMANHEKDISEKKKEALNAVLAALDELMKALEDFVLEEHELEAIITKVKEAITAFKRAK